MAEPGKEVLMFASTFTISNTTIWPPALHSTVLHFNGE